MATVADLTLSMEQSYPHQAQTTLHMHAVSNFFAQPQEGGRRPVYSGEPGRFDGSADGQAWLRTSELILTPKG